MMATSRTFESFARRFLVRSKLFAKGVEVTVKRAAIAGDTAGVTTTPVDTGRARGAWVASIGSPQELVGDQIRSEAETLSANQAIIQQWKLGAGPILLSNSVPYIIPLEDGSSAQAPAGMSSAIIQAAQAELRGATKILGR